MLEHRGYSWHIVDVSSYSSQRAKLKSLSTPLWLKMLIGMINLCPYCFLLPRGTFSQSWSWEWRFMASHDCCVFLQIRRLFLYSCHNIFTNTCILSMFFFLLLLLVYWIFSSVRWQNEEFDTNHWTVFAGNNLLRCLIQSHHVHI